MQDLTTEHISSAEYESILAATNDTIDETEPSEI